MFKGTLLKNSLSCIRSNYEGLQKEFMVWVEYQQTLMLKGSSWLKRTADLPSTQLTAEGTKKSPHVGNWVKPHQSGHSFLLHLFFLTPCLLFSSVCNFFFILVVFSLLVTLGKNSCRWQKQQTHNWLIHYIYFFGQRRLFETHSTGLEDMS